MVKIKKQKTLRQLEKEADKYFSLMIRQRDADRDGYCGCVTCGARKHWKEMDCGHFISRRHKATRYDVQNCAAQCKRCNIFSQGKQFEFGLAIDRRYGQGTTEKLLLKSKMVCKRNATKLLTMISEFKRKVSILQ